MLFFLFWLCGYDVVFSVFSFLLVSFSFFLFFFFLRRSVDLLQLFFGNQCSFLFVYSCFVASVSFGFLVPCFLSVLPFCCLWLVLLLLGASFYFCFCFLSGLYFPIFSVSFFCLFFLCFFLGFVSFFFVLSFPLFLRVICFLLVFSVNLFALSLFLVVVCFFCWFFWSVHVLSLLFVFPLGFNSGVLCWFLASSFAFFLGLRIFLVRFRSFGVAFSVFCLFLVLCFVFHDGSFFVPAISALAIFLLIFLRVFVVFRFFFGLFSCCWYSLVSWWFVSCAVLFLFFSWLGPPARGFLLFFWSCFGFFGFGFLGLFFSFLFPLGWVDMSCRLGFCSWFCFLVLCCLWVAGCLVLCRSLVYLLRFHFVSCLVLRFYFLCSCSGGFLLRFGLCGFAWLGLVVVLRAGWLVLSLLGRPFSSFAFFVCFSFVVCSSFRGFFFVAWFCSRYWCGGLDSCPSHRLGGAPFVCLAGCFVVGWLCPSCFALSFCLLSVCFGWGLGAVGPVFAPAGFSCLLLSWFLCWAGFLARRFFFRMLFLAFSRFALPPALFCLVPGSSSLFFSFFPSFGSCLPHPCLYLFFRRSFFFWCVFALLLWGFVSFFPRRFCLYPFVFLGWLFVSVFLFFPGCVFFFPLLLPPLSLLSLLRFVLPLVVLSRSSVLLFLFRLAVCVLPFFFLVASFSSVVSSFLSSVRVSPFLSVRVFSLSFCLRSGGPFVVGFLGLFFLCSSACRLVCFGFVFSVSGVFLASLVSLSPPAVSRSFLFGIFLVSFRVPLSASLASYSSLHCPSQPTVHGCTVRALGLAFVLFSPHLGSPFSLVFACCRLSLCYLFIFPRFFSCGVGFPSLLVFVSFFLGPCVFCFGSFGLPSRGFVPCRSGPLPPFFLFSSYLLLFCLP